METNQGNADDAQYRAFLNDVARRYANVAITHPVFKTDADDLWERYIGSFVDPFERQHHNCNACRHFIQRYAGLVVIDPSTGRQYSPLWDENLPSVPANYRAAVAAMRKGAENAKIVSPFYSSFDKFGSPQTGIWTHLWAANPVPHNDRLLDAHQRMAAKRQDFIGLKLALDKFPQELAQRAMDLLQAEALYRSDRFTGPMQFFLNLHTAAAAALGKGARDNVIWLAVANNSEGFTHIGSSVLGELMTDIGAGLKYEDVKKRFAALTNVATYQRAQVAPKIGQVEAAEKAVEALGLAPAFARRYTVRSDLQRILWESRGLPSKASETIESGVPSSVFSHLKPTSKAGLPDMDIPPKKVTWDKFVSDVLPGAVDIQYRVPLVGRFCALTTAAEPMAPHILAWDSDERLNPVSWSFPQPAATASEWGLTPGTLCPVELIVPSPNLWQEGFAQHGKGAFLLLQGAQDKRGHAGGGLFPEHLRNELKPYRSTIEAHMNKLTVLGADAPDTKAFGIGFLAGEAFTETAAPKMVERKVGAAPSRVHVILVIDDSGSMGDYLGAARNAVSMLLESVRTMPGEVDVTAIKFGKYATTLCDRVPVSQAMGIVHRMDASSGGTALNDTLADAIIAAMGRSDVHDFDTSFFLGIVTDGEENQSKRYGTTQVRSFVRNCLETGRWTIAYAGAGRNPAEYARSVGIPEGNVKVFQASAEGFRDVGAVYAASTRALGASYASGQRASTSFFAAGAGSQPLGKDHPVLLVTMASGARMAYEIDRWD